MRDLMMSSVSITTAVPLSKKKEMGGKLIDKTIEEVRFYYVEAEAVGFKYTTSAAKLVRTVWPGNKPLQYLWLASDSRGNNLYRRNRLLFKPKAELNELPVPSVPDGGSDITFTVNVAVSDRYGAKARDGCSVRVHRRFEVARRSELDKDSANHRPDIAAVSAPFPGGTTGATLTVAETSSFKRERSWSLSVKTGLNLEVPVGVIKVGYGFDVTEEFSSSTTVEQMRQSGVQASVPKYKYGVWYRKIQPYERHADVYELDESGISVPVGSIILIDYLASYYLGIGMTEEDAHKDARKRFNLSKVPS